MSPAKRKRAPREGEGRPARTGDGPTSNFVVRLGESERTTLRELATRLDCTEAEAARVAIREAVHERFHERTEPGCALCVEYERKTNGAMDAIQAQAPAINAAIADVSKRAAAKMHKWEHADGSAHSAAGPGGCLKCAQLRRKRKGAKS